MSKYEKDKLVRCWNPECKAVIDLNLCNDCRHAEPTKVCPYCKKCLCQNPKFKDGKLEKKKVTDDFFTGEWHIGKILKVR